MQEFLKGNIEKRGIVSNVRYEQKADTRTTKEAFSKDIETKFSYNISFQIDNIIFTYQTKYDYFINNGDEIIVNATVYKNGTYKINFYRNFTNNTDNFKVFFSEYLAFLPYTIIALFGVLYFIFSGAVFELFDAPIFIIALFFFGIFASIYPFVIIPSYIKLKKRIEYFKILN